MKEFAFRHPFISFLIADALIAGFCNVVKMVCDTVNGRNTSEEEQA